MTGAAGFIGYHVSMALVTEWGTRVVGVDTFSRYYDIQLKKDRASRLVKAGVSMYRGDVCDKTLLQFLFSKFNFSCVIHLAAQAGVRHSMTAPQHYLHNNVDCFLRLLEAITPHQVTRVLYTALRSPVAMVTAAWNLCPMQTQHVMTGTEFQWS